MNTKGPRAQKYDPDDTGAVKSQMILWEDTRFIGKYLQKAI